MHPSPTLGRLDTPTLGRLDDDARALLFSEARTANTFSNKPVTDAELTEIWELTKWAPSAANTQPLRVTYVRPGEGRERLVKHLSEGNQDKTLAAPAVAVLAVDTRFHEHLPELFPFRPELHKAFAGNAELAESTSRFNSALQAGYFILAVRAVGLAAGPMAGFDAEGLDAEFFGDGRLRSILLVNIGHPGENAWRERLPRLRAEDTVRFV
jgi:3-hydroxypropanoate dehydrogenase